LLPKTSSSQPTTPLSLLFLMRTDMNTSYSRIDLSCRHFESEICFLLKYFKDILSSILKIMENVDIFFR
jgi:hypothetical protein